MIESIILFIVFVYCLLIIYFIYGNIKKKAAYINPDKLPISIIIPFRNEEKKLIELILSLKIQNYPVDLVEIIFVNDSSEDKGVQIIESEMKGLNYSLFNLKEGSGKKMALKTGILAAKNELIITTDADTTRGENWITQMVQYYTPDKTQLVVGPVLYTKRNNFWEKIQSMEFAALIATTQGAIAQNNSYLCNGANLLFRKATYLSLKEEELKPKTPSGDDVFLLHAIKKIYKEKGSIVFVPSAEAIVYTDGCKSIKTFIQQRLRWAGKSVHYTDFFSIGVGGIVFLGNIVLLLAFILTTLGQMNSCILLIYFLLKWGIDTTLLYSIRSWSGHRINVVYTFLLSLLYPFYIISVAFLSLLFKPDWKGRKNK